MNEKKLKKGTPEYEIAKLRYAVEWREKYIAELKRNIEAHEELEVLYSALLAVLCASSGKTEIAKEELSQMLTDSVALAVQETDSCYRISIVEKGAE